MTHNSLSDMQKMLRDFICRLFNSTRHRTIEHCDVNMVHGHVTGELVHVWYTWWVTQFHSHCTKRNRPPMKDQRTITVLLYNGQEPLYRYCASLQRSRDSVPPLYWSTTVLYCTNVRHLCQVSRLKWQLLRLHGRPQTPFTRYNRLSNPLSNRLYNPDWQPVVWCKRGFRNPSCSRAEVNICIQHQKSTERTIVTVRRRCGRPIVTHGVVWSVCRSVCHGRDPCKAGWTDRDAVWYADQDRTRNYHAKGQFWAVASSGIWCEGAQNYT